MTLFTRLGNAMLHRLAPETSAAAAYPCTTGCDTGYWWESECRGGYLYVRCCKIFVCSAWFSCGHQCA